MSWKQSNQNVSGRNDEVSNATSRSEKMRLENWSAKLHKSWSLEHYFKTTELKSNDFSESLQRIHLHVTHHEDFFSLPWHCLSSLLISWLPFYPTIYHLLPYSSLRHLSATINCLSSVAVFHMTLKSGQAEGLPQAPQAQATQWTLCFRILSLIISKRPSGSSRLF